jgi:hypothetical protein
MADELMPKARWKDPETLKWLLQIIAIPATGWLISTVAGDILAKSGERENNRRVYADMISHREESESTLRKDMFQTILQPVLSQKKDDLEQNVLRMEMLAYNFHDSLDVGPLFKDIYRQLSVREDETSRQLQKRLEDSAREVISKEVDALREAGAVLEKTVFLSRIPPEGEMLMNGEDELRLRNTDHPMPRLFRAEVLGFNAQRKEFRMRLEVLSGNPPVLELQTKPFLVGPFDFPMIDNTRLPGGQRVALALPMPLDGGSTQITLVYFPGSRASLKDRQYYDEMAGELLNIDEQQERSRKP